MPAWLWGPVHRAQSSLPPELCVAAELHWLLMTLTSSLRAASARLPKHQRMIYASGWRGCSSRFARWLSCADRRNDVAVSAPIVWMELFDALHCLFFARLSTQDGCHYQRPTFESLNHSRHRHLRFPRQECLLKRRCWTLLWQHRTAAGTFLPAHRPAKRRWSPTAWQTRH